MIRLWRQKKRLKSKGGGKVGVSLVAKVREEVNQAEVALEEVAVDSKEMVEVMVRDHHTAH